ncbi:YciI family protein [Glutamicibacter sp. PS]|uniref:YciI family protein n=1 Tax=Glutamicibacter sp. PS TaxID=3075634 RepID=UPI00283C3E6B|nr:YciI family protein [Glutamicibacter sp. PS]MDR4533426.1 YciI family protein [Glutamicibacter sp. PS]
MTVFAVEYRYAANSAAVRDKYRPAHREFLSGFIGEGAAIELIASGPYTESDGALLLLRAESEAALREGLQQDPFNIHGTLESVVINAWNPVTGALSAFAS